MHDRLFRILHGSDIRFDAVVVNGGSNDVFAGFSADRIWDSDGKLERDPSDVDFMESLSSVLRIYAMVARYKGAQIVAVTVPPFDGETESMTRHRKALNRRIRDHCDAQQNKKRIALCDLERAFPAQQSKPDYWDADGVHFTKSGYSFFAQLVFGAMQSWLHSKISLL